MNRNVGKLLGIAMDHRLFDKHLTMELALQLRIGFCAPVSPRNPIKASQVFLCGRSYWVTLYLDVCKFLIPYHPENDGCSDQLSKICYEQLVEAHKEDEVFAVGYHSLKEFSSKFGDHVMKCPYCKNMIVAPNGCEICADTGVCGQANDAKACQIGSAVVRGFDLFAGLPDLDDPEKDSDILYCKISSNGVNYLSFFGDGWQSLVRECDKPPASFKFIYQGAIRPVSATCS